MFLVAIDDLRHSPFSAPFEIVCEEYFVCSNMYFLCWQIAKEHGGIMRFIQVSCLGVSPTSPSRMLRAKAAAEEAVARELPEVKHSQIMFNLLHVPFRLELRSYSSPSPTPKRHVSYGQPY